MADDHIPRMPPKPCPICSVAMQATKTQVGVVHRCENCGVILTFTTPTIKDKPVQS